MKLSRSVLNEVVDVSLFSYGDKGRGLPLLIVGEPGEGKSDHIDQRSSYYNLPYLCFAPGEMGDGAVGAVPVPRTDEHGKLWLEFPPAEYLKAFFSVGRGVFHLDELTTAPRSMKAGMLSAIWSRRIGGHYFGRNVRVIASANPYEIAAEGRPLSIPEGNRLIHVETDTIPNEDWMDYQAGLFGRAQGDDDDTSDADRRRIALERKVDATWDAEWGYNLTRFGAFRKVNGHQLHNRPDIKTGKASGPWPSSRSWSMAMRSMTGAKCMGVSLQAKEALMAGSVGEAVALAYWEFTNKLDLPDPRDVLAGKWKPTSRTRQDIIFTVMESCLYVLQEPATKAEREVLREQFCEFLLSRWDSWREIALSATKKFAQLVKERSKDFPGLEYDHMGNTAARRLMFRASDVASDMGLGADSKK